MAVDPKKIAERIRDIRGERSRAAFGRELGLSDVAILNYERGRTPDLVTLCDIADHDLKKRGVIWLIAGIEVPAEPVRRDYDGAGLVAESGPVYEVLKVDNRQERLPGTEEVEIKMVRVPILEDRIAAGPGRSLDFKRIEDWARVPRWKLKRGNSYYMIRVTGDSMEPQLRKGDLILINLSRRDPSRLKEKLVAAYLPDEEGATVKILREEEKGHFWILHARNPLYKDRVIAKDTDGFQVAAVEAAWLNFE